MSGNSEYLARMKQQLAKWDQDLEALAARAEKAGGEAHAAFQEQLRTLRASREAAQQELVRMRAAGAKAGAQMKHGMESAWTTIRKRLDKVSAGMGG